MIPWRMRIAIIDRSLLVPPGVFWGPRDLLIAYRDRVRSLALRVARARHA